MSILVFTPTYENLMRPETVKSIKAQETDIPFVWEIGHNNPYPGRKMANVIAQYSMAREMLLDSNHDALLTVEHDMILPKDTIQKLYETNSPVVYGVYMLRHGTRTINAWQYINNKNLGMSLSLYPNELRKAYQDGWVEVSGVGWGCTLIRRHVLEKLKIYSNEDHDAGDLTFSRNCLMNGFKQVARFDVPCGHIIPSGIVLDPFKDGGIVRRIYALQTINVMIDEQSKQLKKGHYYSVPPELADDLVRAGYARITNPGDGVEHEVQTIEQNFEFADAPIQKRAPKGKKNVLGNIDPVL
jgi:hypothetical protein